MAEPALKVPWTEEDDELEGVVTLQRVVERPDGSLELMERPVTREDYLDPQLEDKMSQGELHSDVMAEIKEILKCRFQDQPDVKVLMDMKHLFYRGFNPSPDISVVRGVTDLRRDRSSFDPKKEGVLPRLVIEIVSPTDARVRNMDEVDKLQGYERVGIPEYLMVYPPRRASGYRFQLKGYRLGPDRRYLPIVPDAKARLLSETTDLRFGVSSRGDQIEVFDRRTGKRLLRPVEQEEARRAAEASRKEAEDRAAREAEARRAAEEEAAREAEARRAAEGELERLRAELARYKQPGR
jgi:Uma2 family endonuclease